MSLEEEVRLGKQVAAEVRPLGLTSDPVLSAIGKRLSAVTTRKELPWRFWVIEEMKGYNAFATPGGFVFISRPYFEKLNEDEAAFVIGHEMAHIDLCHFDRQIRRSREATLGRLLLNVLTNNAQAWSTAADLGATAYVTHYSRVLEREADFTGYRYAEEAGYDARSAVTALSKLGKDPKVHPWIVNIYSTHPLLSSREDRLAALGDEEPREVEVPPPSPSHARNLTAGLQPLDPPAPIAIRILAPNGGRWENPWRKSFTKLLHNRLIPLGFTIAGDDLMYKPDIGDPVEAARSRQARYLLLVTVHYMETQEVGEPKLMGTPVSAKIDVTAKLVDVATGARLGETRFADEKSGLDLLPADLDILHTDTVIGELAAKAAGNTAVWSAKAAGARSAPKGQQEQPG